MTVQRKAFPVEVKTAGLGKGEVEALVSVFGNVDLGGDRVMPGAFAASIARWKADGRPVPVVFAHKWDDPWSHIGTVDTLEETEQGLKARYTLDVEDNPLAAHIYRLMKRGSLKEHSFAYSIAKEKRGEDGANELHELDLIEVGPTLKGMNPETELLAVKAIEEAVKNTQEDTQTKTIGELTMDEFKAVLSEFTTQVVSPPEGESEESDETADVKTEEVEDGPVSDPELLSLQRQINQLRS